MDTGGSLENAVSTTSYVDEVIIFMSNLPSGSQPSQTPKITEHEYSRSRFVYGVEGGGVGQPGVPDPQTTNGQRSEDSDSEEEEEEPLGYGARVVKPGDRPFYTAEEVQGFRSLGELTGLCPLVP